MHHVFSEMRNLTILISYDEPECGGAADATVEQLLNTVSHHQKKEGWRVAIEIAGIPVFSSEGGEKRSETGNHSFTDRRSGEKISPKDCHTHTENIAQAIECAVMGGAEERDSPSVSRHSLPMLDNIIDATSDDSRARHFLIVLVFLKDSNTEVYNAVNMMCTESSNNSSIVLFHKILTHLSNFEDVGLLIRHLIQSVVIHARQLAESE